MKRFDGCLRTCLLSLSLAASMSAFGADRQELAKRYRYPARYCAETNTVEVRKNLIDRLWKHEAAAETKLWPEGKIPLKANDRPIRFMEHELFQSNLVVTDVNDPFFVWFPASGAGTHPAVVILPGGGYWQLGWNKEGTEVAAWLNELGFSAAVLLYRAPNQRDAALADVQRTLGILRRDAAKYAVDPSRIGLIGFSAGANLAIRAATNWRRRTYAPVDAADALSCRPDFVMPIYPWDIRPSVGNDHRSWKGLNLDAGYPVDARTPPSFVVQAEDDFCQPETAVAWDYALRLAGVCSTIRLYPNGGHGYGLRKLGTACDVWSDEASGWLAQFRRRAKRVAFLGDSITDKRHIGCTKNYWGFLGERYGFEPLVYGVNGQQMSGIPGQAARLKAEHPEPMDVIFVFAGTNDYNSNVPIGEWYETTETTVNRNGKDVKVTERKFCRDQRTFRGRINIALAGLRTDFPESRIVLLTPIHRGFAQFGPTNVQPDERYSNACGIFLDAYVQSVREAGNVWGVLVVDIHSESNLYPSEPGQAKLFHDAKTDMLHPSAEGHRRIAEAIVLRVGGLL